MIDKSLDLSCISDPIRPGALEWYVEREKVIQEQPSFFLIGGTKIDRRSFGCTYFSILNNVF